MASTATRIIKNTGWLYAKMAITMFVSLYTTRLILNGLGAEDFGIYNIVGGAISMLGFLNAAMAGATQRFMSYAEGAGDKEKLKSIFNVSIVLHFFIALVVTILLIGAGYIFFHGILNIPESRKFAAMVVYGSLIASTTLTIINVPYDAVMNAHENMKYYAIIGVFESFLKLLVAFLCIHSTSDKLIFYGILMACIPLITLSIMKVYCQKKYAECIIAPKRYYSKIVALDMGKFATWNLLTSISSIATQYGLGVVLNHYFGSILNAAQGIANQLSGQLMAFSNNMLKALNPVITKREGAGERNAMLEICMSGSKLSFLILGCFAIPFMCQMPFILKMWLINVPDWAICFAILQLLRSLSEQLTITVGSAISAQGNIKKFSQISSLLNFMPFLLTFLAFHFALPPYWMYIFWIFCGAGIGGFLKLYFCKKQCNLNILRYCKVVFLPCFTVSLISTFAGLFPTFMFQNNYAPIFAIICSFALFLMSSWIFAFNKSEKTLLINCIKSVTAKFFNRKRNA